MSGGARGALRRTRLRLPIQVKLALVSAALTFVILLLFAVVVGAFTEQRLRASFDNDVRATAADLQERFRVQRQLSGDPVLRVPETTLRAAAAGGATIRVVDRSGKVVAESPGAANLGPPVEGTSDVGDLRVVARPLFAGSLDRGGNGFDLSPSPIDGAVAFVQYAKPRASLDATTNRLHLFFALGILGGTGLAFLAGFAVARRAMAPIAGLTRAARLVARTRDPSHRLPHPVANDEVSDLAATLEEMLRELDAARGETEASLERQREFVADASHELRTPLTSILANLEMLEAELAREDGPRDRAAAADIAGSALRSSRRMRRLVGDLLLLARADAGRQAPRAPVDVAQAVRDAALEAEPLAEGHPLSLDLPEDAGVAVIEGVGDDLHRLALNLIENAFLHTATGTPVIASVRREGDSVLLEVADRGPGRARRPPRARVRALRPLGRGPHRRRGQRAGTGYRAVGGRGTRGCGGAAGSRRRGRAVRRDPAGAQAASTRRFRCSRPDRRPTQGSRDLVRFRPRRPSPALVIACLALFISMGGVSYAFATGEIDGREILNGTITTKDVRNNEVRGADIRNSTIGGRDVAFNTLGGNDIKESTLAGVDAAALGGVPASGYARADAPAFTPLVLTGGAGVVSGEAVPGFDLDGLGYVHLGGTFANPGGFTLPQGARPRATSRFPVRVNNSTSVLTVTPDGTATVGAGGGEVSIDGVTFPAGG